MNNMKKPLSLIAGLATSMYGLSCVAAPCATPNSKVMDVPLVIKIQPGEKVYDSIKKIATNEGARKLAEAAQQTYGSTLDPQGIGAVNLIRFNVIVRIDSWMPLINNKIGQGWPQTVYFDGTTSIEKAILDEFGLDKDKEDPNPCTPVGTPDQSSASMNATLAGGGSSSVFNTSNQYLSWVPVRTTTSWTDMTTGRSESASQLSGYYVPDYGFGGGGGGIGG
jgi:hypothetical protein